MSERYSDEAEAKLKLLAEMTKPCPIYHSANIEQPCAHSSPHCPICLCKGTSRVYTFPTLRKVCPQQINHRYLDGMPESDNYSEDGAVCSTCQGRGWVVDGVHLEDIFAIAIAHNLPFIAAWLSVVWVPHEKQPRTAEEIMLSAIQAIVGAVQAQEERV